MSDVAHNGPRNAQGLCVNSYGKLEGTLGDMFEKCVSAISWEHTLKMEKMPCLPALLQRL